MKTITTVVIYKNKTHIGITNVKESYEDVRSLDFLMCDDAYISLSRGKFNEVIITDLNINYGMLGCEYINFHSYKDYRTYLKTNGYQIDKKYFIKREKNEN